jgi:hypothetical protein
VGEVQKLKNPNFYTPSSEPYRIPPMFWKNTLPPSSGLNYKFTMPILTSDRLLAADTIFGVIRRDDTVMAVLRRFHALHVTVT